MNENNNVSIVLLAVLLLAVGFIIGYMAYQHKYRDRIIIDVPGFKMDTK